MRMEQYDPSSEITVLAVCFVMLVLLFVSFKVRMKSFRIFSAMLGMLAKTGVVSIDAVCSALRESFGKVGEKNVNAARYAYEHTLDA